MASNPPIIEDTSHNSHTDEETIALSKKRSRRVTFADREITSVHIFNSDDDYETPPDSFSTKEHISDPDDEVRALFWDLADSDDSKEISSPIASDDDDNDDSINSRKSFLRPLESPYPGSSSIVGSATSNGDCNLEVTMDSTAFSMHHRSFARSLSGEDLETPAEVRVAIEEKTPSNIATPSDRGSLMILTKDKKVISWNHPGFVEGSGGRDSNVMSLVGENVRSYDSGKLSADLEALLSEVMKDPQAASAFCSGSTNAKLLESGEVSVFDENGSSQMDRKEREDKEIGKIDMLDICAKGESVASMELDEANGISVSTLADHCSSPHRTEGSAAHAFTHHRVQSPIQLSTVQIANQPGGVQMPSQLSKVQTPYQISKSPTPIQMMPVNNDYSKAAIVMDVELPAASIDITSNVETQVLKLGSLKKLESGQQSADILEENSPKDRRNNHDTDQNSHQQHGSVSSFSAKRQQIFLGALKSNGQLSYVTPSKEQPDPSLSKENIKRIGIQPSPLVSSLKDRIEKSKLRLLKFISSATSFNSVVEENNKEDTKGKHENAPVLNLEKHFSSIDTKNRDHKRSRNMDCYRTGPPSDTDDWTNSGETLSLSEDVELLICMSARSLSKGREVRPCMLMAEKSVDRASMIPGSGSSSVQIELDFGNLMRTINASDNFVSPSLKVLDQKLSSPIIKSLSGVLKQQLKCDGLVSMGSNEDKNSVGNVSSSSYSMAVTDKLLLQFAERRPQSGLPLVDINYSEGVSQVKWADDRQIFFTISMAHLNPQ